MKKVLVAAMATLALSACTTTSPYHPVTRPGGVGYSDVRITENRYRVTFSGNSVTSRDAVEMYLLFRSAELTLQSGYDWFATEDRLTTRDTRYVGSPDPWYSGSIWGPYWHPRWRFYRGAGWGRWDPFWDQDWDVRQISRFEASAEIIMHKGTPPSGDRHAFDAREVVANLGPRVAPPPPG